MDTSVFHARLTSTYQTNSVHRYVIRIPLLLFVVYFTVLILDMFIRTFHDHVLPYCVTLLRLDCDMQMVVFSRQDLSRLTFLKVFCLQTPLSDLKMIGVFTSKIKFHLTVIAKCTITKNRFVSVRSHETPRTESDKHYDQNKANV